MHEHAGNDADHGCKNDEPEFVRADEGAQSLRRVQHHIPEAAARPVRTRVRRRAFFQRNCGGRNGGGLGGNRRHTALPAPSTDG